MLKITEVFNNIFQTNTCAGNSCLNCHRISHTTYPQVDHCRTANTLLKSLVLLKICPNAKKTWQFLLWEMFSVVNVSSRQCTKVSVCAQNHRYRSKLYYLHSTMLQCKPTLCDSRTTVYYPRRPFRSEIIQLAVLKTASRVYVFKYVTISNCR